MLALEQLAGLIVLGQAAPAEGNALTKLLASPLPMIAIIGLLMYFMILRPDSRKRKEAESMLSNLKKNDQVVTIGGICGTVVNISPGSAVVTIRVDDGNNTRLRVLRSAISRVGSPEEGDSSSSESK